MAEEKVESPTMDTDTQEGGKKEQVKSEEVDVDNLLKALKEHNITTTEKLSGTVRASKEAGQTAYLLGQERQKVADLERRLQSVETQHRQRPMNIDDAMDYAGEGQTVDLRGVIGDVLDEKISSWQQQQNAIQQAQLKEWGKVRDNRNYKIKEIRETFEDKMKDPNIQLDIQSGDTTYIDVFNDTVLEFKDRLIQQSLTTIETLKKGSGKVNPPHVESGETPAQGNLVSESGDEDPGKQILDKKKKKLEDGVGKSPQGGVLSYEDELDVIDSIGIFPSGKEMPPR